MAVYTDLSLDDINAFLSAYTIGQCLSFTPLTGGTTNTNYRINTDTQCYVLTLFEERSDVTSLSHVHDLLKDQNFPSAQIIKPNTSKTLTLKQKPALIFSWVEGQSALNPNSNQCQQIGQHLASLHLIDATSVTLNDDTKNLLWSMKTASNLLSTNISDDDAQLIDEELSYFRQHSRLSVPTGLIHADCFRDNVLFIERDGEQILSAIIDFEYASLGAFVFDLAIVINDWCSVDDGSLDRLKMRDVIASYSQIRALKSIENQAIPFMLRAAAFRFWISRLSDGDKKQPDEFKRILLHRRLSLSGMQNH